MALVTFLIFLYHLTKNLRNQTSHNLLKMIIFHSFLAITPVWDLIETWGFCMDLPPEPSQPLPWLYHYFFCRVDFKVNLILSFHSNIIIMSQSVKTFFYFTFRPQDVSTCCLKLSPLEWPSQPLPWLYHYFFAESTLKLTWFLVSTPI